MLLPLSQIPELSPNLQAFSLVHEFMSRCEQLRVKVFEQRGATVIDCGVHVEGGLEAGILFSKICLGGLADVKLNWADINGLRFPAVEVFTDHPIRACMASQYAGWPIKSGNQLFMGSGPACAIVHRGSLFRMLGYEDRSEIAILCLESHKLPTHDVIEHIIEACCCKPKNLYVLVAPTTSLVGTVQVAARALETGLFKLRRIGYDLGKILSGGGVCPVSPVAHNTLSGLGRTNDAISYGSTVLCNLRDEDETLKQVVKQVPSCASAEYGRAYMEISTGHDNFFNLSPDQFNPAVVWLCNLNSGNSFHAGVLRPDVLSRSFGLEYADPEGERS
ncbi:methenyltetrahydromethanopterin cyclohydrolase [Candidatus Formimonas warabiya]|uniref:Methenyltetrahydromethanopterin cyclohydrolase n=1 Tax=Formimonas warabiya TaxID=1761012 RepID=A0A3G1KMF4_FORW1|nr:methenyltetrahydromethanopterin cyclohydrolase [Candidatus Formimonas warabiya]ATW23584.1 methenyltetrahydromethanopterin cyclohydrolase [Candidatus Formimonas warabiya]